MSLISDVQLSRICVSLESEDKSTRKKALDYLHTKQMCFVSPNSEFSELPTEEINAIWDTVSKKISRTLTDPSEACRNITVEIWKNFLQILPVEEKNIVYLIPILSRRLSFQEIHEPSEEVRLNYVSLLRVVIAKYSNFLAVYVDDFFAILARTVTDKYPEVKRESCQCIEELAKAVPEQFYSRSESLVKPVLSNFNHRHYKVRVASVMVIGQILQYGNSKSMEQVSTPMAERLFDQSGAVRLAVVEVTGCWLLELRDRYSWWHKLIPLLVTGLHDEIESIRNRAGELWDQAGRLYMQENESDQKFKDKMDYILENPTHYPPNIKRPNLGCRVIVQQNLCKLVGGISRELGDWLADIRVRSAQLLCVLVLNVEQDVTQHIETLLPAMYRACNDEDSRVVTNVELAAEYMGYFVPPEVYCQLVLPTLEETITPGHLRVLAGILRGSEAEKLCPKLVEIGSFLHQPHVCRSKKPKYQEQLLRCCESLIIVCKKDCSVIGQELFTILLTLFATCVDEENQEFAENLLIELAKLEELNNLNELFELRLRPILMALNDTREAWTIYSAELQIFRVVLSRAAAATTESTDLVLSILKSTMSDSSDPELRLKLFILLSDYFSKREPTLELVDSILRNVVLPGLVWRAGRSAEAIRTAAVCCLCALLDDKSTTISNEEDTQALEETKKISCKSINKLFLKPEDFSEIFAKIVPILVTLVDDNAKKTRLYALRAICLVIEIGRKLSFITEEHIHSTYPVILKRLDDGCDGVRSAAVQALVIVWGALPKNYDLSFNRSQVDYLYTTAIVHLDDPEATFQSFILDALMVLAKVHPELLAKKIENCKENFRNQSGLEKLLKNCYDLLRATN